MADKVQGQEPAVVQDITGPGIDSPTSISQTITGPQIDQVFSSLSVPSMYNRDAAIARASIGQDISDPGLGAGASLIAIHKSTIMDLAAGRILKLIAASPDRMTFYAQAAEIESVASKRPLKEAA